MTEEIQRIVNEKTDSISIEKGMGGKFGYSVKIYGNLNIEGEAMLSKVKEYVEKLNALVGGEKSV